MTWHPAVAPLGRERNIGAATAARLRATTAPYILRREKKEVLPDRNTLAEAPAGGAAGAQDAPEPRGAEATAQPKPQGMGRKNDFIVWLRLAPMQRSARPAWAGPCWLGGDACTP